MKSTKTAVHYRRGDGDHQCGECSMFRAPHKCTAVVGYIKPVDLCDLFERKQDYADGGAVRYSKAPLFTIPDDVAKRLGHGDLAKGLAAIHAIFELPPAAPLGQLDPFAVGNGDIAKGRAVLNKFVAKVRQPLPGKTVLVSGPRGAAAINVSRK